MVKQTEEWCGAPKLLSRVSYCLLIRDALKKLTTSIALKKAKERITYFLLLLFYVSLSQGRAFAQLTPDTTLGGESSVVTPGVIINNQAADRIDGGASRGANLFHSFLEFNLNAGQRVYFASPIGIETIITRVTGVNPSNILGTLGVNGSANLFLINPNGILFGPNARLDVRGSFFASTASSVVFADGNQFSAKTPQNPPLLTVSVPLGVQYGATPGPIQVQGSRLEVPQGRTLGLLGGEVTLQGATVAAPGGRVELGSVAGNSVVSLKPSGNDWQMGYEGVQNFQDIQLSNRAVVNASGQGGGDIQVWARSLRLGGESRLEALTLGSQPGGQIAVNASNSVELTGTGTRAYLQDLGLFLTGQVRPTNLRNGLFTLTYGSGAAGNVVINTPSFIARNGALVATSTVATSTVGSGRGGDLTINGSDNVELTTSALITGSGFGNSGAAGDLTVNTQRLLVRDYGVLVTSSLGANPGGDLTVNASQSVELIGTPPILLLPSDPRTRFITGLFSTTFGTTDAGEVRVTTQRLSVRDGASIGASTAGTGKGGNIMVTASDAVEIIGKSQSPDGNQAQSSLAATAVESSTGGGGNLTVRTGQLILQDEGRLSVRNRGTGDAGNLNVVADSIRLDNGGSIAAATEEVARGGGNIQLQTQSLQLHDNSIITAQARGSGKGGDITIDTDTLALDSSNITASASQSAGGNITINAADSIRLDNQARIAAATEQAGEGGSIKLQTQSLQLRNNSSIDAQARNNGNGGNVRIDTDTLVAFENSNITADANLGNGGNITINTRGLFRDPTSKITASSNLGITGVVDINTEINNVEATLPPLPQEFVSSEQIVADSCLGRRNFKGGSFTVTGTGGLPSTPYGAFTASYPVTDVQLISQESTTSHRASTAVPEELSGSSSVLQEAQGMYVTADGRVVLGTIPQLEALAKAEDFICR